MKSIVDSDGVLRCAHCEDSYLHRTETRHYLRVEDAKVGTLIVTTTDGGYTKENASMICNPSARRSGLTVEFWCEVCGESTMLSLSQHKGVTLVNLYPAPYIACD